MDLQRAWAYTQLLQNKNTQQPLKDSHSTALTQLSTQWPIQQHHQPWRTRPRGRREGWPRHASTAGGGSPPDAQRRGERRAACRRRQDPERPGYASARQAAASYPLEQWALRAARPRAPACRRLPETRRSAAGAARRRAPSRRPRPPCGTSRAPWRPPGSRYGLLGGRRALRRREWRARASGGKLRGRGAGMGCALPPSSELRCFQLGKKKKPAEKAALGSDPPAASSYGIIPCLAARRADEGRSRARLKLIQCATMKCSRYKCLGSILKLPSHCIGNNTSMQSVACASSCSPT